MKKSFLQGYVTVRRFGGYALPVPMQNKLLRNYCEEKNFSYILPQCEMIQENNYTYLFHTLESMKKNGNLGMCSVNMLPNDIDKFEVAFEEIKSKNIVCHFLFEDKVVKHFDLKELHQEVNLSNLLKIRRKETFKSTFNL